MQFRLTDNHKCKHETSSNTADNMRPCKDEDYIL